MTSVVKSDNEINSTKAKITHKKHYSKNKYNTSSSTTKNLVNIQPKPSPPFILPCQPPFIYPNTNSPSVVAQQQLFSLQLLMSSPYLIQALANINKNSNQNGKNNTTIPITAPTNTPSTSNVNNKGEKATSNNIPTSSVPSASTPSSSSPSKLSTSAPNSLPTNPLPFIPPNLSLPYFAAALASLNNQQMLNNTKNNGNVKSNNISSNVSTTVNNKTNSKINSNNIKPNVKSTTNSIPPINPSLFPKTDNTAAVAAAANAALLLNNSIFANQFLQILQQQQQNKSVLVNPFAATNTSSSAIPIAANTSKSNSINISSSCPTASKIKSKISSSSSLINKPKNSKLSTSPNMKSKIKLPIKKDPLSISKNHRRPSIPISQSYDSKNQMMNSLFNIVNSNNNINKFNTNNTNNINNKNIRMENESEMKDPHNVIVEESSPESLVSGSPSNVQASSPLLPIVPFSNLNIRSNHGSSPTIESNILSAPNLSTLCTVASQEAKLFIPEKSDNKETLFNKLSNSIKGEENENKMDTEETNIFSKLETTNRSNTTSLLTKNIQNNNKLSRNESTMMNEHSKNTNNKINIDENTMLNNEQSNNNNNNSNNNNENDSTLSLILNNGNVMGENSNKIIKSEMTPLPKPISMPMSLPTITIRPSGFENNNERNSLKCFNNLASSISNPLNVMSSSPQSPSAFSSTSSSSSSPKLLNHSIPHTALQRRKSRSMNCSKDYVCEICKPNKHFIQLAHLRIHQRKHTGERPFVCSFCNKSFAQQGNLKTHQRKHTGERPFSCPICFKTFTQSGNLKAHELLHQGVKPFVCEWCDKTFTQSGNLKTHQLKMHPELFHHSDDALLKSPISSTRSSEDENDDRMLIDKINEDEDNNQMILDDDIDNNNNNFNTTTTTTNNNNTNYETNYEQDSSYGNSNINNENNNNNNTLLFDIDNEDYDEIQPMESGVICTNTINQDNYYENNYYQNISEEREFEEEDSSKLSTYDEFEDNNDNFDTSLANQPENNIKERQLLKRLKALLKRN